MEFRSLIDTIKKKASSQITFAAAFAFSLFAQCVIFQYLVYDEILVSTLWHNPLEFIKFYSPKVAIALLIASISLITKKKTWCLIFSIIISLWCLANLWYYKANGILIDNYAIRMSGNLKGFYDSIFALLHISDLIYIAIPVLVGIIIKKIKNQQRTFSHFCISLIASIIIGITGNILVGQKYQSKVQLTNPFQLNKEATFIKNYYVQDHSIITYLAMVGLDMLTTEDNYELDSDEIMQAEKFVSKNSTNSTPTSPLIVILIESFDNFVLNEEFMPNLQNFINNQGHILYASKVVSQVKAGVSADGQMIIQTGLLPLNEGAVCYRFPNNDFPSISKLYKESIGIFPHNLSVWNQLHMSKSYSIDTNIVSDESDQSLIKKILEAKNNHDYILTITMSTHMPYNKIANESNLETQGDMPELLKNYIKSFNSLDNYLKTLLSEITDNEILQKSTIVITGDHKGYLGNTEPYKQELNIDEKCPLIIYSPSIENKVLIDEECYQMDIYPTILHLIGCDDYYWKGFGVNLLDSAARANRPISAEEAFILSDKLIRANYFEKYEK